MKALRIGVAAVVAVIVVFVVAAVILVATFDPNDYKQRITAYVQDRTGRTLTIDDDIELSLFPWFAIETGGVSLSDDPAFGDSSFVTIDEIAARVRVWPLLRRHIEIGRVIVSGVDVNLGVDAEGRGNWASLTESASPASTTAAGDAAAANGTAIEQLAIEGIELDDARISWHDAGGDAVYLIQDLGLTTGPIHDTDPVDLALELTLLDVASQMSVDVELDTEARFVPAPELGDTSGTVRIKDSRAAERIEARFRIAALGFDAGLIRLSPASLDARLTRPPVGPEAIDLTLELAAAELDTKSERLVVDGLALATDVAAVELDLTGDSVLTAPRLTGRMAVDGESIAGLLGWLRFEPPQTIDLARLGGFAARTDFTLGLMPLSLELPAVAIAAAGVDATARLTLGEDGAIAAAIELPSFRPSQPLGDLIAALAPGGIDTRAIGAISAGADLSMPPAHDRLSLTRFSVGIDAARLSGEATLSGLPGLAEARGSLTASGLDTRLLDALAGSLLPERLRTTSLGEFRAATNFRYRADARLLELDSLALTAYGLSGSGRASIDRSGRALAVTGEAQLGEFSPRELMARFGLPVPQSADPGTLGSARLAASFETSASAGRFSNIVLDLDDSHVTGDFNVVNFADPTYNFALAADSIDVDRYLPPRAAAADAAASSKQPVLGEMRLDNEALTATRVAGAVSVGALTIGGMRFERLSTVLDVGDGRAALRSVQTALYGGTFAGSLEIDATGAPGRVRLAGNAENLAMRPLLDAMLGDAYLGGTGSFALDLTGRGNTVNEALQSAAGTISVSLSDGQLDGVNVGRELCAAINAANKLPAPPAAADATAFSVIRGSATVTDGVASTSDLYASTGFLNLTGSGRIRLADQWLDTNYVTRLVGPIELPGCDQLNARIDNSIPIGFYLKGELPDPDFGFDIKQLLEDWARQGIRNRVDDARDRVLDRLRQ